jgi:DNA primase
MNEDNTQISLEICRRLGINLKGKTSGNILVPCLSEFHEDKHPSCSISLEKGLVHCFSCGFSANLKNLYFKKFGRSIYRDLGIQYSLPLQKKEEEYLPSFDDRPEVDFELEGRFFDPDTTDASKEWIEKRGFNVELLKLLKIQLMKSGKSCRKSDPTNKDYWMFYKNSMIIPIFENGKIISFEARTLQSQEKWKEDIIKKGLDPEKLSYKKVLYPKFSSVNSLYKLSELKRDKKLYVVEGLMDVISLRTEPFFQNSTCTFGANITERQFYLLSQFRDVCIIPNEDAAGMNSLKKFQEKNVIKNLTVLTLPANYKDVNEILQKKNKLYSTLKDVLDKDWIKNKERDLYNFDIEKHFRR